MKTMYSRIKKITAGALCAALVFTGISFAGVTQEAKADDATESTDDSELTYEYEGYTYTYEVSDDEVSLTGCTDDTAESLDLPDEIDGMPVTDIARSAFRGFTSLKTCDLPENLETIQMYAFYNCQSLTEVCFPDSMVHVYENAYYNCTDISYVLLPAEEITIGENNFAQSTSVETIEYAEGCTRPYTGDTWEYEGCFIGVATTLILPSSVTSIDTGTSGYTEDLVNNYYLYFENLTNIVIPEDNEYFSVYDGCIYDKDQTTLYICAHGKTEIEFPDTVTTIAAGAFANCNNLTEVIFPDTVTTIQGTEATSDRNSYGAFRSCASIEKITVPSSVTFIGEQAFISCDALTDISFYLDGVYYHFSGNAGLTQMEIADGELNGETVKATEINDDVFGLFGVAYKQAASYMTEETEMQADLTTVILSGSAEDVDASFFDDMTSLTAIQVSEGDGAYYALDGVLYKTGDDSGLTIARYPAALEYTQLEDGITTIGEKAFYYCTGTKSFEFPDTVTTVETEAFYNFRNATVTFSEGLTTIGDRAFYEAWNTVVYLPASVASIGTDSFYTLDGSLTAYCYSGSYAEEYLSANGIAYKTYDSEDSDGNNTVENNTDENKTDENKTDENKTDENKTSDAAGASVGTKVTVGNAVYKVTSGTEVTYVKSTKKNVSKVTIPATVKINGKSYKVTQIAASAFAKNKKLKTVVIGKNVKTIGKKAFYNCKNLKKITFKGKNVKTIGAKAFKGTAKKAVVKVPKAKKAAYKKLLKKAGLSAKATVR